MRQDVKANSPALIALRSRFWMGYFLITIVLIGFPLSAGIYIPLFFAGFIVPGTQPLADRVMRWGIGWLMRVQPWFNSQIDLQIPEGGVLLASNHRSHLDVFCLLSNVRGIRILAKASLFWIPFLNVMMFVSRQIPTRRGRLDSFWHAMKTVRQRLVEKDTVHVFPEMTRCQPGASGTADFMIAPFMVARETGVPVVPIVIQGTDDVWPRGWFGLRPHQPVHVRSLPPLDSRTFASAEALRDATRAQINAALAEAQI